MIYFAEPNAPAGTVGGNTWASAGELVRTVNWVRSNPSSGGDEIWCLQGQYNLTSTNLLRIVGNTQPLFIYGGFDGTEITLCDRNANIVSNDPANFPDFFQNPSILDGGNTNRVIEMQNAQNVIIDGFLIRNGYGGNGGNMDVEYSNNILFENVVIMNGQTGGAEGGGMYIYHTSNVLYKNMIFFNNSAMTGGGGGGLFINDCNDITFVNVLFNANSASAGNAILASGGGGSNLKIINCTIADNGGTGASVECATANLEIYNTIIYPDTLVIAGGTATVEYCLLNQNNIPNPGGLSFGTPPNFVNQAPLSAGGDYHLRITPAAQRSQCIDAGNTRFIFPLSLTDLEGKPRFINGAAATPFPTMQVDMGAFEVQ